MLAKMTLLMLHVITNTATPREHITSVTSKGQITIPASVRTHLKLDHHRKVAVVVQPDGSVRLRTP
jgi:AbrB family looped-hinge helix DNA binding protein